MATKKNKRIGVGYSETEIASAEDKAVQAVEKKSGGAFDKFNLGFGDNLFLMMPSFNPEFPRPYKSAIIHYNPLHVCMRTPPQVKADKKTGKTKRVRDNKFSTCFRCQYGWETYGYDTKEEGAKKEWRASDTYREFKKHQGRDVIAFLAIPMNAFYKVERQQKSARKFVDVLEPIDNLSEVWDQFEKEWMDFVQSDKFKEVMDQYKTPPAMKFEVADSEFFTGVQLITFSFNEWYGFQNSSTNVDEVIQEFYEANNQYPWGINDKGFGSWILKIGKSGDKDDYTTIEYATEIFTLEDYDAVEFSDEFIDFLVKNPMSVSDFLNPPSGGNQEIREIMSKFSEGRGNDLRNAPECFADEGTYDPINSNECFECSFRQKCAEFIRKGEKLNIPGHSLAEEGAEAPTSEGVADEPKTGLQKKDVLSGQSAAVSLDDLDMEDDDDDDLDLEEVEI